MIGSWEGGKGREKKRKGTTGRRREKAADYAELHFSKAISIGISAPAFQFPLQLMEQLRVQQQQELGTR